MEKFLSVPIILAAIALPTAICSFLIGAVRGGLLVGFLAILALGAYVGTSSSSSVPAALLLFLPFALIFGGGALGLGIVSGVCLRQKKPVLAILFLAPLATWVWISETGKRDDAQERLLAKQFVEQNRQLILLNGRRFQVNEASPSETRDKSRGIYEFLLVAKDPGRPFRYAVVEVVRSTGSPSFTLRCVTTDRSATVPYGGDRCSQGIVSLPDLGSLTTEQRAILDGAAKEESNCSMAGFKLPGSFEVHTVETYRGMQLPFQIDQSGQEATQVNVIVNSPGRSVVLMLSGNDPSIWNISWTKGTTVAGVLTFGYNRQVVAGVPKSTPVFRSAPIRGNDVNACYNPESPFGKQEVLVRYAERLLGRKPDTFGKAVSGAAVVGQPQLLMDDVQTSDERPPQSFFDPAAPLAGQAGVRALVAKGLLRKITLEEALAWQAELAKKGISPEINGRRIETPNTGGYAVLGPVTLPEGMYGSHSTNFLVLRGVEKPKGNRGHSPIFDMNTLECEGC